MSNKVAKGYDAKNLVNALVLSLGVAAAVVLFSLPVAAAERYVAVGGTGDGTSAATPMGSLTDAYAEAAVGATSDSPGVVHLASGMYRLGAPIEMKPYVKVIGDEAGPTIVSGDNKSTDARAAFWSKNFIDSTYVIKPGIAQTPVWNDDLTFNEPNPDGLGAWYCTWYGNNSCNTQRGFVNASGNAEDNVFENITFTLFSYGAFLVEGGSSGTLTLRNCTFIGDCCNGLMDNVAAVGVKNGSVDIDGCEFIGCMGCVRLTGSGFSRIASSTFRENSFRILVEAQDTHLLSVSNCVFRRNWQTNSNRSKAIVYANSSTLGNQIVDCTFANNFFIGGVYGAVCLGQKTNNVLRCNFVGNSGMDFSYDYPSTGTRWLPGPACCGVVSEGSQDEIRDCSFVGNTLTLSANNTTDAALCNWKTGNSGRRVYFNCAFAGNTISSDGSGVASLLTRQNSQLFFVHCMIYGNSYVGTSGKVYPFYSSYNGSNNLTTLFCNSIFEEDDFNGSPFKFVKPEKGAPTLLASVVRNFDASVFTYASIGDSIVDTSTNESAKVCQKYVKSPDGRRFPQLSAGSSFRRAGYPVYADSTGLKWLYLPRSNKWYRMDTWSLNYSPEGIVLGESPLVPDALGEERVYGKVALGPVNSENSGFILIFR